MTITARVTACMRHPFAPFSAYRYQFCISLSIHAHLYAYVSNLRSSTFSFFRKCGNNFSERNINDLQLQNSNLEFGITRIFNKSVECYFKEKQQINRDHPAEPACKMWRKNFQPLLSNHILCVGSFLSLPLKFITKHVQSLVTVGDKRKKHRQQKRMATKRNQQNNLQQRCSQPCPVMRLRTCRCPVLSRASRNLSK